jgi:polyferredoxin
VLVLLCAALLTSLLMRSPVKLDVVRDRGVMARLVEDGYIENLYRMQIMNTTEHAQHFRLGVEGMDGIALAQSLDVVVAPADARWIAVAVRIPPQTAAQAGAGAHPIRFLLRVVEGKGDDDDDRHAQGSALRMQERSTFVVPR